MTWTAYVFAARLNRLRAKKIRLLIRIFSINALRKPGILKVPQPALEKRYIIYLVPAENAEQKYSNTANLPPIHPPPR